MRDIYRKLYTQQKSNAKQRGVPFLLTLEQWKQIWLESGKWDQRGRGADKYCMCRIGDSGAYELGNVFIGLGKKNVSDGNIGKTDSAETKRKKSVALSGKPKEWVRGEGNPMHRLEVKAKISAAIGGEKHYNHKGVNSPSGYFATTKVAAEILGVKKSTVEWRCKHNKLGFSYAVA